MESLWNAIDDYVAVELLKALGADSDYPDLQVAEVRKMAQFDTTDLAMMQLPACIVMSWECRTEFNKHGTTPPPRDMRYSVVVFGVVEAEGKQLPVINEQATRDAKTLLHRIEKALTVMTFGVTTDDGTAKKFVPGEARMQSSVNLWQRSSTRTGRYGVSTTGFTVGGTL